jgi:hypothetical protein
MSANLKFIMAATTGLDEIHSGSWAKNKIWEAVLPCFHEYIYFHFTCTFKSSLMIEVVEISIRCCVSVKFLGQLAFAPSRLNLKLNIRHSSPTESPRKERRELEINKC